MRLLAAMALMCALPAIALAQAPSEPAPITAPNADAAAPATIRIPAGTVVQVEFVEAISSNGSHQGDVFAIRLAEPIIIGDRVVVPAGAMGGGEVIDAEGARVSGREGTLVASGRYLEINGQRVRIRAMQVMRAGGNRSASAAGMSFIPVFGMVATFTRLGGEIEVPAGTRTTAVIAVDVDVPALTEGE